MGETPGPRTAAAEGAAPLVIDGVRIRELLPSVDALAAADRAFRAFSEGRAVLPPVIHMAFDDVDGEVHVKCGWVRGDAHYVVKVASGFYRNPGRGLPSGDGLMLLFDAETGAPTAILLDRGLLTDERTGAAGAVAARALAPDRIDRIGVFGTGVQARQQLAHLEAVTACRAAGVWGPDQGTARTLCAELETRGWTAEPYADPDALAADSELILTVTPARAPLFRADAVRAGTHVTAVGSDSPGKQELDPALLGRAHVVCVDSRTQCLERGEAVHAVEAGVLRPEDVVELGDVLTGRAPGRTSAGQITVADLTGLGVQDATIATAVLAAARS